MHVIDVLFFAAVAAFLLFRLYSVLGQKRGNQKPEGLEFRPPGFKRMKQTAESSERRGQPPPVSDEDAAMFKKVKGLRRLSATDPSFSPMRFLKGAETAFERILVAFTEGDLKPVERLLAPGVKTSFAAALRERKKRGRKAQNTLVSITAELTDASLSRGRAELTVAFKSEQIRSARGKDADLVEGDGKTPVTVTDKWVFSRAFKRDNPNWVLTACN